MPTREQYRALTQQVAQQRFGTSPLASYYYAMMRQESRDFDPDVVEGRVNSSAGAQGIAQLMPPTARGLGVNPLDPQAALNGAADYLTQQIQSFNGDIAKGVAAYNAGGGRVQEAIAAGGPNWANFLPAETRQYLSIVQPVGNTSQPAAAPAPQTTPQPSPYVFPVQGFKGPVQLHWGEDKGASDLFAPRGTPILAMTDGTIMSAGWSDVGGNNVTLQGDDGNIYYMAHLDKPASVQAGQRVQAGTYLGPVGNTGNASTTDPHLHLGIGPTIAHGTGPHGGAGENFDAVGLLQQTLAGAPPNAPQGGAGMVTQVGRPPAADSALVQMQEEARTRYSDLLASEQTLRGQLAKLDPNSREAFGISQQLGTISKAVNDAADNYVKLSNAVRTGGTSPTDQANIITALGTIQHNQFADQLGFSNALGNILHNAFSDNVALANLMFGIYDGNRKDAQAAMLQGIQKGSLSLEGAMSQLNAIDKQNLGELARGLQAMQRADFIRKGNFENAVRLLPSDVKYQPFFGPDDPMNQVFKNLGLNPVVIQTNQQPVENFDPLRNLAAGEQSMTDVGITRPDYGPAVANVGRVAQANEALPTYGGQTITPAQVGAPASGPDFGAALAALPQGAPNYDLAQNALIQQILGGMGGGQPSGGAASVMGGVAKPAAPSPGNGPGTGPGTGVERGQNPETGGGASPSFPAVAGAPISPNMGLAQNLFHIANNTQVDGDDLIIAGVRFVGAARAQAAAGATPSAGPAPVAQQPPASEQPPPPGDVPLVPSPGPYPTPRRRLLAGAR